MLILLEISIYLILLYLGFYLYPWFYHFSYSIVIFTLGFLLLSSIALLSWCLGFPEVPEDDYEEKYQQWKKEYLRNSEYPINAEIMDLELRDLYQENVW